MKGKCIHIVSVISIIILLFLLGACGGTEGQHQIGKVQKASKDMWFYDLTIGKGDEQLAGMYDLVTNYDDPYRNIKRELHDIWSFGSDCSYKHFTDWLGDTERTVSSNGYIHEPSYTICTKVELGKYSTSDKKESQETKISINPEGTANLPGDANIYSNYKHTKTNLVWFSDPRDYAHRKDYNKTIESQKSVVDSTTIEDITGKYTLGNGTYYEFRTDGSFIFYNNSSYSEPSLMLQNMEGTYVFEYNKAQLTSTADKYGNVNDLGCVFFEVNGDKFNLYRYKFDKLGAEGGFVGYVFTKEDTDSNSTNTNQQEVNDSTPNSSDNNNNDFLNNVSANDLLFDYILDQVELLSNDEYNTLSNYAKKISKQYDVGIYMAMTYDMSSLGYDNIEDLSDDLFSRNNLGIGSNKDGILFCLDIVSGNYDILVNGEMANDVFSDDARSSIISAFRTSIDKQDKYGIFADYIDECEKTLRLHAESHTNNSYTSQKVVGYATVLVDELRIRDVPSTKGNAYVFAEQGKTYEVYEVQNDGAYDWYKIGDNQWIANNGSFCNYQSTE